MADAQIRAVITAKDEASGVLKNFSDNIHGVGSTITGVAEVAAKALIGAGVAAVGFGALSLKAYSEHENVQTQIQAAIKSTHDVSGLYIQDLNDQAAALQRLTRFSKDQVGTVQALILTFTQIRGPIAQLATPAILDLATAMHEDLQSASIQVGKALNDPVKGITALHRIGVTFSDTQKKQIKAFVDTNQVAKAQAIILKELGTEFGGSAIAAGGTFSGSLEKVKNNLKDLEITIGGTIAKYLEPLAAKAATALSKIDWQRVIDNTINSMKNWNKVLVTTYQTLFQYLAPGIRRFIDVAQEAWHWIYNMLEPSFTAFAKTLETQVYPQLQRVWKTIEPGFTDALKVWGTLVSVTIVAAMWLWINVLNVGWKVIGFGIQLISNIIKWFGNLGGVVVNIFRGIPNAIVKAFDGLEVYVEAPFKAAFKVINAGITDVENNFNRVKNDIGAAPGHVVSGAAGLLHKLTPFATGGFTGTGSANDVAGVVHRGEYVIPQSGVNQTTGLPKGSSGNQFNITIQAGAFTGNQSDARKHAMTIIQALQDIARSKNIALGSLIGVK